MAGGRSSKAKAGAAARARATRDPEGVGQLLQKTKWCKFFFEGKCQRGRHCTFAHCASELQAQPDLYRSQLCLEFSQTGQCRYGEGCRFAHGEGQLRQIEMQGEDLKMQLEETRHQVRDLEAQLASIEGAAPDLSLYDGAWEAWPADCADYADAGWGDAAWGAYACHVFAPMAILAPWAAECDAASQRSTDCDGGGSSGHGADTDGEEAGSARTTPRVVVRNTFLEFEAPTDEAPARRRAHSAPCGRAAVASE